MEHTTGGFGFWSTMLLTPRLVALLGIVLALCALRVSDAMEFRTTSVSSSPQWWPPLHPPGDRPWKASDIASEPHESLTKTSSIATVASLSGGAAVRTPHQAPSPTTKGTASCVSWFRPGSTSREKTLALWLLVWNSLALGDALLFTFRPSQNLNGYLVGEWGLHTLAMTRMLANCQLGLIASSVLVALTAREPHLKAMFKIMIACTLGAFRAVSRGVADGTIKAPWKTGYASFMTLPPLLLLSYFAFMF